MGQEANLEAKPLIERLKEARADLEYVVVRPGLTSPDAVSPITGAIQRIGEAIAALSVPAEESSEQAELERYAALGRACESNGLGWYEAGEMRFQAPGEMIAELAVQPVYAQVAWMRRHAMELLREIAAAETILERPWPNLRRIAAQMIEGDLTAPAEARSAWAPIATAPRDGTPFIGWAPGNVPETCCAHYSRDKWLQINPGIVVKLTHWMPLPTPPKAEAHHGE